MILILFLPLLFIGIMFSYFWALCIYECLFLRIKSIYKALIILFVLALLGGSAFYLFDGAMFIISFAFGLIALLIILLIFRKQKLENINLLFYIKSKAPEPSQRALEKYRLILFSIGLLGTLTSIWQLEVPQRIIVNYLSSINIFNEKYKDIVSENSDYEARVYTKNTKKLFLIEIDEQDIYLCHKDKPFCEGSIEKIGERRLATYKYGSTLHCALKLGGSCDWITPSNVGSFLGIYNLDNKINNKGQ